jgi:hypothetical protein
MFAVALLYTLVANEDLLAGSDAYFVQGSMLQTHQQQAHAAKSPASNTAGTIASWTALNTSVTAAAGKAVTLTLSTTLDMGGFKEILISTAKTHITIIGNGATFDANYDGRFFTIGKDVTMVISNVTLTNGYYAYYGDAINVRAGGTVTVTSCTFSGNAYGGGNGGAIFVSAGGTVTATSCAFSGNSNAFGGAIYVSARGIVTAASCTFSNNVAGTGGEGGALFFEANSTGLLKNCSLTVPVSNPGQNNIARADTTANVTFACADGFIGPAVQMTSTEITMLPAINCSKNRSSLSEAPV